MNGKPGDEKGAEGDRHLSREGTNEGAGMREVKRARTQEGSVDTDGKWAQEFSSTEQRSGRNKERGISEGTRELKGMIRSTKKREGSDENSEIERKKE